MVFQIMFMLLAYSILLEQLKTKANQEYLKHKKDLKIYFHCLVWPNFILQLTSIYLLYKIIYNDGQGAFFIGWL